MIYVPPKIAVEAMVEKWYSTDLERVREISTIRLEMFNADDNRYESDESIALWREYRGILNRYRHYRNDLMAELKKTYYDVWDF